MAGNDKNATVSLPVRGAWVEMFADRHKYPSKKSLPVRGAWVEIFRTVPPC